MAKLIKLNKKDDVASVIKKIKDLKDKQITFILESGSVLLANSANLKLLKRTGEALGKKVRVQTDDELGMVLAAKAGVLDATEEESAAVLRNLKHHVQAHPINDMINDSILPRSTSSLHEIKRAAISSLGTIPSISSKFMPKNRIKMTRWKKLTLSGIVAVILLILVTVILLPQASIVVYARSEPVTRDMEISVDKSVNASNSTSLTIPGKVISREMSKTETFDTTGKKQVGTKASGSVTIYNFTKNTLTLKASTTTLVANGKKYFFTRDATGIRPTGRIGSGNDQEVDQTTLVAPIPIIAENPGADHYLPLNTKFEIKNTALGNNPNVYAQNEKAILGGVSKEITVLSQEDIDKATLTLTENIIETAEDDLKKESSEDQRLITTGTTKEILAKTANKNVGDEVDKFDMTMIARISGLTYDEKNVRDLIVEKIDSVLSDDKYILEGAEQIVNARFKSLDLANGKGLLSIHFETSIAYKLDEKDLAQDLAGKNAFEIKELLLSRPEVDRVDVKFSPFFVNRAPKFNGKIYISSRVSE